MNEKKEKKKGEKRKMLGGMEQIQKTDERI